MKKLMTLMLGLAFVTGTVALAQDTMKKDDTTTTKKKKAAKKKKDDTTKKDGKTA